MKLTSMLLAVALLAMPAARLQAQNTAPRPTNVRLTFRLIEADGFKDDDPEIRPVVAELRKLFRFQGYKLMTTSILTGTSWPPSTVRQTVADDRAQEYVITADLRGGTAEEIGISVSLTGLGHQVLIQASVNLQDGKTVVLGTARGTSGTGALILTVTPTINP